MKETFNALPPPERPHVSIKLLSTQLHPQPQDLEKPDVKTMQSKSTEITFADELDLAIERKLKQETGNIIQ